MRQADTSRPLVDPHPLPCIQGAVLQVSVHATRVVGTYFNYSPEACGVAANGYTAAISQLTFGSEPGLGPGDACGRCFSVTGTADPYSPSYTGPFKSIVVKVTDMCPAAGNQEFCSQTASNPTNEHGASVQ